jgi:hypothetical protein
MFFGETSLLLISKIASLPVAEVLGIEHRDRATSAGCTIMDAKKCLYRYHGRLEDRLSLRERTSRSGLLPNVAGRRQIGLESDTEGLRLKFIMIFCRCEKLSKDDAFP